MSRYDMIDEFGNKTSFCELGWEALEKAGKGQMERASRSIAY